MNLPGYPKGDIIRAFYISSWVHSLTIHDKPKLFTWTLILAPYTYGMVAG